MSASSFNHRVLKRFLADLLSGETIGASDGRRYGVSWLANCAVQLRGYGVAIVSVPRGKGLKGYYVIHNKNRARNVLKMLNNNAKAQTKK
jgi:hypothetical protein